MRLWRQGKTEGSATAPDGAYTLEALRAEPHVKWLRCAWRQHMSPQRLELVKRAGYRVCLSAYSGISVVRVERCDVLRRGTHWTFSDEAFLCECQGLS